jgi:hypothetical protein
MAIKRHRRGKRVLDRLNLSSSYRAGNVRLLWAIAQDLGLTDPLKEIGMKELVKEETHLINSLEMWVAHFF